jgi:hypothetical protein
MVTIVGPRFAHFEGSPAVDVVDGNLLIRRDGRMVGLFAAGNWLSVVWQTETATSEPENAPAD